VPAQTKARAAAAARRALTKVVMQVKHDADVTASEHLAELFIIECREGAGRGAHCCCNATIMDVDCEMLHMQ
jgi:hypothetical protein